MCSDIRLTPSESAGSSGRAASARGRFGRPLSAPRAALSGLMGRVGEGIPGPRIAVEALEGSQSWVLGRCLRQIHSLHSLPSLHALEQGRKITCHIQGATHECQRCSYTSTSASASGAALLHENQQWRSALQQCISTKG